MKFLTYQYCGRTIAHPASKAPAPLIIFYWRFDLFDLDLIFEYTQRSFTNYFVRLKNNALNELFELVRVWRWQREVILHFFISKIRKFGSFWPRVQRKQEKPRVREFRELWIASLRGLSVSCFVELHLTLHKYLLLHILHHSYNNSLPNPYIALVVQL